MKIVIVGAGEVGSHLAALLSEENLDVVVIESSSSKAEKLDESLNVKVVTGNGSSAETLASASVETCDYFLAMTSDDRSNLIATSLAKGMGANNTIARIHDQTYTDNSYVNYQLHFGIDHLMNPEALCAVELAKSIRNSGRVAVENFARGQIEVQQIELEHAAKFIGKSLKECKISPNALVGYLERDGLNMVPTAETVLELNDVLTFIGTPERLLELRAKCQPKSHASYIRVVLFGGGEIAIALIRLLQNPRFRIRVIDENPETCRMLAEKFDHITVIQGDGTSLRLMEEEQIGNADYFVACTKSDENNIVTGLQASKLGVEHIQVVINKSDYNDVLDSLKSAMGVELIVSPRVATANEVKRYISTEAFIELGKLPDGGGSIYEFEVQPGCQAAGQSLRELPLPDHCRIAAIQRKFKAKVPDADDVILGGDRLLILTHEKNLKKLRLLLRND